MDADYSPCSIFNPSINDVSRAYSSAKGVYDNILVTGAMVESLKKRNISSIFASDFDEFYDRRKTQVVR